MVKTVKKKSIRGRFNLLTFWNKLNAMGSAASIVSLAIAVLTVLGVVYVLSSCQFVWQNNGTMAGHDIIVNPPAIVPTNELGDAVNRAVGEAFSDTNHHEQMKQTVQEAVLKAFSDQRAKNGASPLEESVAKRKFGEIMTRAKQIEAICPGITNSLTDALQSGNFREAEQVLIPLVSEAMKDPKLHTRRLFADTLAGILHLQGREIEAQALSQLAELFAGRDQIPRNDLIPRIRTQLDSFSVHYNTNRWVLAGYDLLALASIEAVCGNADQAEIYMSKVSVLLGGEGCGSISRDSETATLQFHGGAFMIGDFE